MFRRVSGSSDNDWEGEGFSPHQSAGGPRFAAASLALTIELLYLHTEDLAFADGLQTGLIFWRECCLQAFNLRLESRHRLSMNADAGDTRGWLLLCEETAFRLLRGTSGPSMSSRSNVDQSGIYNYTRIHVTF